MIEFIAESLACAIVAWVFCIILIDAEMIFEFYGKLINKLPSYLAKPLGECEYCFSGQIALWYYIYAHFHNYDVLLHITFISITIFAVRLINKIIYGQ